MTTHDWLHSATTTLAATKVPTARLDCLVLLEDATGRDRAWLLAHPEFEVTDVQVKRLETQLTRRAQHVPLAYIRGHTEFYGREFVVNEHVLEPRPETEAMIAILKALPPAAHMAIADIGTGSGAIAITAKLELPNAVVFATDIDPACLAVARVNAARHHASVTLAHGNLLAPLADQPLTTLLCNLPYVPSDHALNQAATHEPRLAIFGGADGLTLYRDLFIQIDTLPTKPTHILTESLPLQHAALADLAAQHHYQLAATNDFVQHFRAQS